MKAKPKKCATCGNSYEKKNGVSWYQWRRSRFCSRQCFRKTPVSAHDFFWARVKRGDQDTCWLWRGSINKWTGGYGYAMRSGGVANRAHRVSWELHNGAIPDGLFVLHRCDNPPCVNPAHLFLGTNADNMADMAAKGRHGRTILTPDQVRDIRRRLGSRRTPAGVRMKLSSEYGVSVSTIKAIKANRFWRHVK